MAPSSPGFSGPTDNLPTNVTVWILALDGLAHQVALRCFILFYSYLALRVPRPQVLILVVLDRLNLQAELYVYYGRQSHMHHLFLWMAQHLVFSSSSVILW